MTGVREMVIAARAAVENLAPADAAAELDRSDVMLVDVREPVETATGCIPGAVRVPRGVLEFRADRSSAHHLDGFAPGRRVIVYSSTGARSALAARSLQELGYHDAAHLDGGLEAWNAEGRPLTAPAVPREPTPHSMKETTVSDHADTIASAVQLLNEGDVDGYVTTLYAHEAVFHGFPAAFAPNREGIAAFFRSLRSGVADATISAQDLFAAGDRVAVRFTLTGTHTGELFGAAATGAPIDAEGITILRFSDGRCVERWNRLDDLTFMAQIGALPAPAEI